MCLFCFTLYVHFQFSFDITLFVMYMLLRSLHLFHVYNISCTLSVCIITARAVHVVNKDTYIRDGFPGLVFKFRPFQFNYLSYDLFFGKILSDSPPPQKKKSRLWCFADERGLEIFCQTPKKKGASFKNIHCKGDSINYRNLSML